MKQGEGTVTCECNSAGARMRDLRLPDRGGLRGCGDFLGSRGTEMQPYDRSRRKHHRPHSKYATTSPSPSSRLHTTSALNVSSN